MASGTRLFGESLQHHLSQMQNQLRMSSYPNNLNTTQPFSFTNTTSTTPLWSHVDFVPEKIVELSVTMDGLRFYKVQWHHSWVAEHQLFPFQHVLQHFWIEENNVSPKSSTTSKKLTTREQNTTELPSISNLSSKGMQKQDINISSTTNKTAEKPVEGIVSPVKLTLPSIIGRTDEDVTKVFVNNEISGKTLQSSECKNLVDPTLATDVDDIANSESENIVCTAAGDSVNTSFGAFVHTSTANSVNTIGDSVTTPIAEISNGVHTDKVNTESKDNQTYCAEPSDQTKSYEQEISKVLAFKSKHERLPGRTVNCDGLDILAVENTNVTDDMLRAHAHEILGSFKKKRRKYENGESYNDPHPCFFCKKVLSNGRGLRYHNFQVHLKNFGHLSCDICQQRFFFSRHINAHKRMHSEVGDWVCKICQAVFKFADGLSKHMKIHQKESNFRCDVCHKNFKLQADLKTHCLEEHMNDVATCNVCKAKLQSGYSVYMHSLRHSGTRDHECDECGRSFKRKHHLEEHKKTHSGKGVECPVCNRKVNGRNALISHITSFHKEYATACRAKLKCKICDKPFRHKGKMDIHMKLQHTNETREDYQKKNMARKNRRKGGLRAKDISDDELARLSEKIEKVTNEQTGEVRVRCKMCKQAYLYVACMGKHLEDHKNGKWKRRSINVCKHCGVKYKSKYYLLKHRNLHCHGRKGKASTLKAGKPRKPIFVSIKDFQKNVEKIADSDGKIKFKCKICPNREFQLVRALKKHLQEHKNVNITETSKNDINHLCGECGKSFKTKKRLQLHLKISHQETNMSESELSSINSDERKNRKRKQQFPLKLSKRGKRNAALNAQSILFLQIQEVSSAEEDEVVEDGGSDFEPYNNGDMGVVQ